MKTILIKCVSRPGNDTNVFKSYAPSASACGRDLPLGFAASTTSNAEHGALHCAAKTFMALNEPHAERDEIETRIRLLRSSAADRTWTATLEPKS